MILFNQMLAFFIFMVIGYYARKKDIIDDKGARAISWLVGTVANPALIITGVLNCESRMSALLVLKTVGISILFYGGMSLVGLVLPKLLRVPDREVGSYRNLPVYTNIGFMGIPLLRAYSGPDAVLRISVFIIMYNVFLYSACIANFQHSSGVRAEKFDPKKLLSVGMLSCVAALILNFVDVPIPAFAETTLDHLSNMSAALSMISIGTGLARSDLKILVTDVKLDIFAFLKMLVLPIGGMLVLKQFVQDPVLLVVMMLLMATPVGSMVSIMADQYDPECTVCVRAVALTSLMAVVTVPLVSLVTGI